MTNDKPQLISRKRHYFYVLVFSVAVWLFIAMACGGFAPIYKTEPCDCEWHSIHFNISYLVFGAGGIIWGVLSSFVINRWMLVAYTKPEDNKVPLSRLAHYGKSIFGWKGLIGLILIFSVYIAGDKITHTYLRQHPNVTEKPEGESSLLHCAASENNISLIRKLLSQGADVNATDTDGSTPLFYLMYSADNPEIVALLIDAGADIFTRVKYDFTLLHVAVSNNRLRTADFLLNKGAEIEAENSYGATPLYEAVRSDLTDINMLRLLIDKGANVNTYVSSRDDKLIDTVLDLAERLGKPRISTRLLRSHGAKTGREIRELENKETGK